jgi:hypothetical protein
MVLKKEENEEIYVLSGRLMEVKKKIQIPVYNYNIDKNSFKL